MLSAVANASEGEDDFSILVATMLTGPITRTLEVTFTSNRSPHVALTRMRDGYPVGSLKVFWYSLPLLGKALEAVRLGKAGLVGLSETSNRHLAFHVAQDEVSIGWASSDGTLTGAPWIFRGSQIDRLAEAHCLAARFREGARS